MSVTLLLPAEAYAWVGFCSMLAEPSPKSQLHDVGKPVDVSVNCTVCSTCGLMGLNVKPAVGGVEPWVKLATTVASPSIVKTVEDWELLESVPPVPDQFPNDQCCAGTAESVIAVPDAYPWAQVFALAVTVPPALGLATADRV